MELQTGTDYVISGSVTEYQKWTKQGSDQILIEILEQPAEFQITPSSDDEIELLDDSVNGSDTLVINAFNDWQMLFTGSVLNTLYRNENISGSDWNSIIDELEENGTNWLQSNGWVQTGEARYEFNAPVELSEA